MCCCVGKARTHRHHFSFVPHLASNSQHESTGSFDESTGTVHLSNLAAFNPRRVRLPFTAWRSPVLSKNTESTSG